MNIMLRIQTNESNIYERISLLKTNEQINEKMSNIKIPTLSLKTMANPNGILRGALNEKPPLSLCEL